MKYDEALEKWGLLKLGIRNNLSKFKEVRNVNVSMNFNKGFSCCNGSNPDCYCSYAESPTSEVVVTGVGVTPKGKDKSLRYVIDVEDFDFATMIKELFEMNK